MTLMREQVGKQMWTRDKPKVLPRGNKNLSPNRLASSTRFAMIEEACDVSLTSRICEKRGNVDRYKQVQTTSGEV